MNCPTHGQTPYASYARLIGIFLAIGAGGASVAHRRREVTLSELLLLGLSTHKITNLLATDRVTSVIRAPFTEQEDRQGEIEEHPKGSGPMRAMGELLTCQYCLGPWISAGLVSSHALAPRWTRGVVGLFAVVAISDTLHHLNSFLKRAGTPSK